MPDFTSALFLDWRHEPGTPAGWSSLTTGRPAALDEPPLAIAVGDGSPGLRAPPPPSCIARHCTR